MIVLSLAAQSNANDAISVWLGRLQRARFLELRLVMSADINAETFASVDDVLAQIAGPWRTFSIEDKQAFIVAALLYGNAEGGSLEMLDELIGKDDDRALALLSIDKNVLNKRLGLSDSECRRIDEIVRRLQDRRIKKNASPNLP